MRILLLVSIVCLFLRSIVDTPLEWSKFSRIALDPNIAIKIGRNSFIISRRYLFWKYKNTNGSITPRDPLTTKQNNEAPGWVILASESNYKMKKYNVEVTFNFKFI